MQLVDASGKRILQIPAQKRNGISRIPINISGVPAGVYFLQIKINEQTVVEKVMIN
jgi:Secretion system C-terminal sorting domain